MNHISLFIHSKPLWFIDANTKVVHNVKNFEVYMAKEDPQMKIRLPIELKSKIQ